MGAEEAKVQTSIINWLSFQGAWFTKTIASVKNGTPDIVGVVNGQFFGIEVKKPGGKPSPLQRVQLRKIREAGGVGFTAESLNEVKDQLNYLIDS